MTTAPASTIARSTDAPATESWKVLLPYGLAIVAQLPMLVLYFKQLWSVPHYQPFAIAILATIGIALYRWPFDQKQPFVRSLSSDILLVLGLFFAFLGLLFVEPWFAAASVMLIVTSLFARTIDREMPSTTLWPCALPLFVYLTLPAGMDVRLITKLQQYSAEYTSKILDLAGLGHHMNGTVINVPAFGEYGIEQACSGVQSFFTLLLVAVVFIVMSRRLRVPSIRVRVLSIFAAFLCLVLQATVISMPVWNELLLIAGIGFLINTFMGFRATTLILSAVFWAVFMNTVRIMLIPLADYYNFGFDLSHGIYHDILGYAALAIGILMLFSTDQFLLFLFAPVEIDQNETGEFGSAIPRFWNSVLSGSEDDESTQRTKKPRGRMPLSKAGRAFIWVVSGLMIAMGLFQLFDVQQSFAQSADIGVRFFDDEVIVDFEETDIPEYVGTWKQVEYETEDRSRGSDLGQRSDTWQLRSPTLAAVVSLDQPFPGWHELTKCYTLTGWKLIKRTRKVPSEVLGESAGDDEWAYIEAEFEKNTGEKGYLLFSFVDAFGEGLDAPGQWGTVNSFVIRARNRMSHRVRASLFRGEAYQIQVFVSSFNELSDELKQEANEQYLEIRDQLRSRFIEKKKQEKVKASKAT